MVVTTGWEEGAMEGGLMVLISVLQDESWRLDVRHSEIFNTTELYS